MLVIKPISLDAKQQIFERHKSDPENQNCPTHIIKFGFHLFSSNYNFFPFQKKVFIRKTYWKNGNSVYYGCGWLPKSYYDIKLTCGWYRISHGFHFTQYIQCYISAWVALWIVKFSIWVCTHFFVKQISQCLYIFEN